MSDLALPRMKIGDIVQIGIVVRILKSGGQLLGEIGIGPWNIIKLEPPILREVTLRGEPVDATMLAAIAQSGGIQLESFLTTGRPEHLEGVLGRERRGPSSCPVPCPGP